MEDTLGLATTAGGAMGRTWKLVLLALWLASAPGLAAGEEQTDPQPRTEGSAAELAARLANPADTP